MQSKEVKENVKATEMKEAAKATTKAAETKVKEAAKETAKAAGTKVKEAAKTTAKKSTAVKTGDENKPVVMGIVAIGALAVIVVAGRQLRKKHE